MSKPFNSRDHFRPIPDDSEGGYMLSMAATIWMAYGCIFDLENTPPDGRAKARLLVSECIALFKAKRVPTAAYLETWLLQDGAKPARVLPVLADACEAVGDLAVAQVVNRVMGGA